MSKVDARPNEKHPPASLYIGDLLPSVTEAHLYEFFSGKESSVASIRICRFHPDISAGKKSLSYAYVNFHNAKDAETALDALNHKAILGKPCRIMWQIRDPSQRKSGIGNLFVKNLPTTVTAKDLSDAFSPYGDILSTKVATNEKEESKGFGFVHFASPAAAEAAIQAFRQGQVRLGGKNSFPPDSIAHFVRRPDRLKQRQSIWTNLFVKGLEENTNQDAFMSMFKNYGEITSAVVMPYNSKYSTKFGFVNYATHEQATNAMKSMHEREINGQKLWCGPAKKKSERLAELEKLRKQSKGTNLYLKNFDDDLTEERLRQLFEKNPGDVASVKIARDEKSNSRGFGFISFVTSQLAQEALQEKNGRTLPGLRKPIYVAYHEQKAIRQNKLANRFAYRSKPPRPMANMYGPPVFYPPPNQYVPYPPPVNRGGRGWPAAPQYPVPLPAYQQQPASRPKVRPTGPPQQMQHQHQQQQQQHQQHPAQGQAQKRQQPPRKNPTISTPSGEEALTMETLLKYPEDQQRLLLGERLYPIIQKSQPHLAGKITGMLLDSGWHIEELLALLYDEEKLNEKVADAAAILEKVNPNQN